MSEQKKQKCYISGKITGLPIGDAIANFNKASQSALFLGYEPINPMNIQPDGDEPKNDNEKWSWFMKADIKAMMDCDAILMQDNWQDSKGAIVEHDLARSLGFNVIYIANKGIDREDIVANNKEDINIMRVILLLLFIFSIFCIGFFII